MKRFPCRNCGVVHPEGVSRCEVAGRMKANGETPLDQPVIPVAGVATSVGVDRPERRPTELKTGNRRTREAYNGYMREYMVLYRKRKRTHV